MFLRIEVFYIIYTLLISRKIILKSSIKNKWSEAIIFRRKGQAVKNTRPANSFMLKNRSGTRQIYLKATRRSRMTRALSFFFRLKSSMPLRTDPAVLRKSSLCLERQKCQWELNCKIATLKNIEHFILRKKFLRDTLFGKNMPESSWFCLSESTCRKNVTNVVPKLLYSNN